MALRSSILAAGLLLSLLVPGVARAQEPEVKVTIDADDEPLISVVKKLCSSRGLDYVASESALLRAGKVSLKLTDVPLTVALETICEVYGLDAHMRGRIIVIRLHEGAAAVAPPAPRRVEETPRLVREPGPVPPPAATPVPAPVAEVTSHAPARPPALVAGGGGIVVGSVIEVAADSVTVKEDKGEPRVFLVPQGNDDDGRTARLLQALKRLHKGDRIALECRTEGTRSVVVNLVGGGKPQ